MSRLTVLTSLLDTFRATLTSGLMVLASLVIMETQLVSSAFAEVMFLNSWGSTGSGDGQFSSPKGIAVSGTGQVYVADLGNDRIQRFGADDTAHRFERRELGLLSHGGSPPASTTKWSNITEDSLSGFSGSYFGIRRVQSKAHKARSRIPLSCYCFSGLVYFPERGGYIGQVRVIII